MSIQISCAVWGVEMANPGRKLVALALADHADEAGYCWPSMRRIAAMCGMDRRSVRRHIAALHRLELVESSPQFKSHGQSSNAYRFATVMGTAPHSSFSQDYLEKFKQRESALSRQQKRPSGAVLTPLASKNSEETSPTRTALSAASDSSDLPPQTVASASPGHGCPPEPSEESPKKTAFEDSSGSGKNCVSNFLNDKDYEFLRSHLSGSDVVYFWGHADELDDWVAGTHADTSLEELRILQRAYWLYLSEFITHKRDVNAEFPDFWHKPGRSSSGPAPAEAVPKLA